MHVHTHPPTAARASIGAHLQDVDTNSDEGAMRFDDASPSDGANDGLEADLMKFMGGLGLPTRGGDRGSAGKQPAKATAEKTTKKKEKAIREPTAKELEVAAVLAKAAVPKKLTKKAQAAADAAAAAAAAAASASGSVTTSKVMKVKLTKKRINMGDDADDSGAAAAGEDGDWKAIRDQNKGKKKREQAPPSAGAKQRAAPGSDDEGGDDLPSGLSKNKEVLAKELKKKMLVEHNSSWHSVAGTNAITKVPSAAAIVVEHQQRAATLLLQETGFSEQLHAIEREGDEKWMRTILKDGTLGDRLAAWMMKVQESPIHRLKALDTLVAMVSHNNKRLALLAMDTLSELWQLNLLPDRKLVLFSRRPLEVEGRKKKEMDRLLIIWQYEAELKERYKVRSLRFSFFWWWLKTGNLRKEVFWEPLSKDAGVLTMHARCTVTHPSKGLCESAGRVDAQQRGADQEQGTWRRVRLFSVHFVYKFSFRN